jgi:hypothetical protein
MSGDGADVGQTPEGNEAKTPGRRRVASSARRRHLGDEIVTPSRWKALAGNGRRRSQSRATPLSIAVVPGDPEPGRQLSESV